MQNTTLHDCQLELLMQQTTLHGCQLELSMQHCMLDMAARKHEGPTHLGCKESVRVWHQCREICYALPHPS